MPLTFEQGELEAEFPPFILDEIYRAGKLTMKHNRRRKQRRQRGKGTYI